MYSKPNIPYYLLLFGLFIILKYTYTKSTTEDLSFLLKPTSHIIGSISNSPISNTAEQGYFLDNLNVVINKSCSGYNFWLLSSILFAFLMINHLDKSKYKILSLPIAFLVAYILSIFVNSSRIFVSLVLQNKIQHITGLSASIIHEAIGVAINLTFLFLAYLFLETTIKKLKIHAKFT